MKIVRSDAHRGHFPAGELHDGELVRPFECPERIDFINDALAVFGEEDITELAGGQGVPSPELLRSVHDSGYLQFLASAWNRWADLGRTVDMIPTYFPGRRMGSANEPAIPASIGGALGWYAFSADTAITAGSYDAAMGAAALAHTGQQLVSGGASSAFALCRPPGHHAATDYFGGYCFLNNAAIAAQGFLDDGAERVAVLDVDFHHGNGTQDIFYRRDDVLFLSLHGDPADHFPYFSGAQTETGEGPGENLTVNYPLVAGTSFDEWMVALDDALGRIRSYDPDALVISLGVDTYEADPISSFKLASDDFSTYGRAIGALDLPTLYCMEGGYAVEQIGVNTVNVLTGHLDQ